MYKVATQILEPETLLKFGDLSQFDFLPADMGLNGKRIIDKTHRVSEKAKCDIEWPKLFLKKQTLKTLLKDANVKGDISFSTCEILKYGVGSFFDTHVDTVRHNTHIGTILAVFPSENLKGGDLIIEINDYEKITISTIKPYLVFIPLDTVHSVSLIKKGYRIVAKAAVLTKPKKIKVGSKKVVKKILASGRKD